MYQPVPLLSIDPSSTKIGWALLGAGPAYLTSGVWYLPAATGDERIPMVGGGINAILHHLGQQNFPWPALALIEMPDYIATYAKPRSIVLYFRSVGAAELALSQHGLRLEYVKASAYRERLRKEQAKERFRSIAGRHPYSDDESDAVCIGWDYLAELVARRQQRCSPPADLPPL